MEGKIFCPAAAFEILTGDLSMLHLFLLELFWGTSRLYNSYQNQKIMHSPF